MTLNEAIRRSFPGCYIHIAESGDTLFGQHFIVTPEARSKSLMGTAYRICKLLAQYADDRQMIAIINAERVETFNTDEKKLERFYRHFGFVEYEGVGARGMIRYPRHSERDVEKWLAP